MAVLGLQCGIATVVCRADLEFLCFVNIRNVGVDYT